MNNILGLLLLSTTLVHASDNILEKKRDATIQELRIAIEDTNKIFELVADKKVPSLCITVVKNYLRHLHTRVAELNESLAENTTVSTPQPHTPAVPISSFNWDKAIEDSLARWDAHILQLQEQWAQEDAAMAAQLAKERRHYPVFVDSSHHTSTSTQITYEPSVTPIKQESTTTSTTTLKHFKNICFSVVACLMLKLLFTKY